MSQTDTTAEQVISAIAPITMGAGTIEANTPLLSTGVIDSLSVAELAEQLSELFDVKIDIMDLGVDNADTATQLAALVNSRRG